MKTQLLLLSLLLFSCDLFPQADKKRLFTVINSSGSTRDPATTTADGKQGFLIIGDSKSLGLSAKTVTVPSNICYEFTTTATVNYTTASNFAYQYHLSTGYKPVIIPSGLSGSYIYGDATVRHWGDSDVLRSEAFAKANAFLTEQGLTKLEAIILVIGINDASTNVSGNAPFNLSLVESGLTNLLNAINTAFPDTEILIEGLGQSFSAIPKDRVSRIRGFYRTEVENRPYLHFGASFMNASSWGLYSGDGLHPSTAGYDYLGLLFNRSLMNKSYSKNARAIISNHYDEISPERKTLINNFINTIGNQYNNIDALYMFKTSHNNNIYFDWSFTNTAIPQGGTFTVDSHIETTSTTNYFRLSIDPSISWVKASLNDWFMGAKLKDGKTAAGTLAYMFGAEDATRKIQLAQHNTNYLFGYNNNNSLSRYNGATAFLDNTFYGAGSDGTKLHFTINATDFNPIADHVPTALVAKEVVLGGVRLNAGSVTLPYNGEYSYFVQCRYSANRALIYSALETLIAAW